MVVVVVVVVTDTTETGAARGLHAPLCAITGADSTNDCKRGVAGLMAAVGAGSDCRRSGEHTRSQAPVGDTARVPARGVASVAFLVAVPRGAQRVPLGEEAQKDAAARGDARGLRPLVRWLIGPSLWLGGVPVEMDDGELDVWEQTSAASRSLLRERRSFKSKLGAECSLRCRAKESRRFKWSHISVIMLRTSIGTITFPGFSRDSGQDSGELREDMPK